VDEANAALAGVTDLVERVRHGAVTLQVAAEALAADGVVLRDPERGLIDFAGASSDGRPLWLCWVVGEPVVAFWHWPDDGFAGRQPISAVP